MDDEDVESLADSLADQGGPVTNGRTDWEAGYSSGLHKAAAMVRAWWANAKPKP